MRRIEKESRIERSEDKLTSVQSQKRPIPDLPISLAFSFVRSSLRNVRA